MHALRRRASRVRVHARVRFLTVFFFFFNASPPRVARTKAVWSVTLQKPTRVPVHDVIAASSPSPPPTASDAPPCEYLHESPARQLPRWKNMHGIPEVSTSCSPAVAPSRVHDRFFPPGTPPYAAIIPPPVPPVRRHHSRIHHHHLPPPVRAVRMKPTAPSSAEPEPAAAPLAAAASSSAPSVRPSRAITLHPHPTPRRRFQRIQTHPTQRRIPTDDGSKVHNRAHLAPFALAAVLGTPRRRIHRPRRRPPRSRLRALAKRSIVSLRIPRPLAISPIRLPSSTVSSSLALASPAPTAASSHRARVRILVVVRARRRRCVVSVHRRRRHYRRRGHRRLLRRHHRRVVVHSYRRRARCGVSSRRACMHECMECTRGTRTRMYVLCVCTHARIPSWCFDSTVYVCTCMGNTYYSMRDIHAYMCVCA